MKFFIFAVIIASLTSCGDLHLNSEYQPSQKSKLVDEISKKVFAKLLVEQKLFPIECGGRMMHQITLLHWGFHYYEELDIDKARELLVTTTNEFLEFFNCDERIRPYLATHPFTPKNVQIRIFLCKPNGSLLAPEKLHVVSMIEGELAYKVGDKEIGLRELLVETFEEGKKHLQSHIVQEDSAIAL